MPRVVLVPLFYYFNKINYPWITWLIDSDRHEIYLLNMLVLDWSLRLPT